MQGVLGCAHAELTIDDIVDLLNLRNPGAGGIPNIAPFFPGGVGNVPFPALKNIIDNNTSDKKEKDELIRVLKLIDKMYNFPGATFSMGGKSYPYTNSKDVEYIKSIENKNESDPTIQELEKMRQKLEDLIKDISFSKMPRDVDVGTVIEFLDDQGKGPLEFLYKLDNRLMPEDIGEELKKIINKIKKDEGKYKGAVLKYNQNIKERNDLSSLRPYNLNFSEHELLKRIEGLENIVAVTDRERIESILTPFFRKLSKLDKDQSGVYEATKRKVDELQREKEEIDGQIKVFYRVLNPMEGMSDSQKVVYELQNQAAVKEYQEQKKQEQERLKEDRQFQELTFRLKDLTDGITDCNKRLDGFKKMMVGKSEVYKEIRILGNQYPLNYSKAMAALLNQPVQDVKIEGPTISADTSSSSTTDSKIVKPAIKKPSDSKPKRPLTRSVATTKEEKKAVEEENPFQLPAKKGKTGNQMDKYEKDLGSLRTENANLRQQLKEADSNRRAALAQQEDNFRQRMDETLKRFTDDNYNLNNLNERLNKIISQRDRELKDVREQLEQLRKQLGTGNAGALKNNENNNNNTLKDRISALERELAAERAKNANSEQNAKEVVTERIVRRGGTTTVIEDTGRIDALTKDIEARNAQLSQQQSALDSKDAQIRQLQQRNQQLQNQLNAQEDNKQSPASNEPSVNEENLKLQRQQLEEMVAELENKQNELKDREAEVSKREQTVNQMQQTTNNVLQMLNRQNNEASKNVNADQSEATKNGNVEMMPQVQLGA